MNDLYSENDPSGRSDPTGHERIAPAAFEPSEGRAVDSGRTGQLLLGLSLLALLLLCVAGWFMFSARSVNVAVSPIPQELELTGSWLKLRFSDRWLIRSGDYEVTAELEGYRPLEESITVTDVPDQQFTYQMVRLPGLLTLNISPPDINARALIGEMDPQDAPLSGLELPPGEYPIEVRAERFKTHESTIVIDGGGQVESFDVTMEPDWAVVEIASNPVGATLHVDGEPVGETPLAAEILSGNHLLEIRMDGFKAWETEVAIVAGENRDLPTVVLEKADHVLSVSSSPSGASVAVNNEYQGQTPISLNLRPDTSHQVTFSKPGYSSATRYIEVLEGDRSTISARLNPILGTVTVVGEPADARVFVDGVQRGLVGDPMQLPAHPHRIEVRKEGHETYRATVTPNPDLAHEIRINMPDGEAVAAASTPPMITTANGYALKLVRPSGIFQLGSPRREQGRRSNEFIRQVQLERPFYFGITEVSNGLYKQFDSSHDSNVVGQETLSLADQPAVRVTWNQAAKFCNWLSNRDGHPVAYREVAGEMRAVSPMTTGYRLPTEAEWVLMARYQGTSEGQAALKYPWGDQMPPTGGSGNYAGSEARDLTERQIANYSDDYAATAGVGRLSANRAGIKDLGGNVAEWMHDVYEIRAATTGTIATDPMGLAAGELHTVRGSSWRSASITDLRLAWRGEASAPRDSIGFRVVRYAQ